MNTSRTSNQGSATIVMLLVVIIILVAGGGAWYFLKSDDKPAVSQPSASAPSSTNPEAPSVAVPDLTPRAKYIYQEYTPSQGVNRYEDLQAKGYITANLVSKAKEQPMFDLLTCSQNPAQTYTYDQAKADGTAATLVVTGDYTDSKRVITTTWIKEQSTWKIDKVVCPSTP